MIDKLPEYLTEDNVRLLLVGAGSTALVAAALRRLRVGGAWVLGWIAAALSFFLTHWTDWPDAPARRFLPTVVVGLLSAVGLERVRRAGVSASARLWTMLAVCGAIWLAIPENRPVVVVAGAVSAMFLLPTPPHGRWVDSGFAFATAWSVLLGAHVRDWALVGGLLCAAPLAAFAVVPRRRFRFGLPSAPWLVVGTAVLGFASARWVGVAPDATVARVVVIGAGAVVLAAVIRR